MICKKNSAKGRDITAAVTDNTTEFILAFAGQGAIRVLCQCRHHFPRGGHAKFLSAERLMPSTDGLKVQDAMAARTAGKTDTEIRVVATLEAARKAAI